MPTVTATAMPAVTTTRGFNLQTQFATTSATYVDVTSVTLTAVAENDELALLWAGHIQATPDTADCRLVDSGATTTFIQLHIDAGATASTYVNNSGKGVQNSGAVTDIKVQLKRNGSAGQVYCLGSTGITALNSGVESVIITGRSDQFATKMLLKYSLKTVYGFTASQENNYNTNVLGMTINPTMVDGDTFPSQVINAVTDGGIFIYTSTPVTTMTQLIFDGGIRLEVIA